MVEIKKHGTKPEPKAKPVKSFTCPKCGCEFETDEYSYSGERWISASCPENECGNTVYVETTASAILG